MNIFRITDRPGPASYTEVRWVAGMNVVIFYFSHTKAWDVCCHKTCDSIDIWNVTYHRKMWKVTLEVSMGWSTRHASIDYSQTSARMQMTTNAGCEMRLFTYSPEKRMKYAFTACPLIFRRKNLYFITLFHKNYNARHTRIFSNHQTLHCDKELRDSAAVIGEFVQEKRNVRNYCNSSFEICEKVIANWPSGPFHSCESASLLTATETCDVVRNSSPRPLAVNSDLENRGCQKPVEVKEEDIRVKSCNTNLMP